MKKTFKKHLKQGLYFFISRYYLLRFLYFDTQKIKQSDIVFFLPYYHTGGAERVHIAILKALQGTKCTVVFTHGSATKNFYKEFSKYASIVELNSILNKKNKWVNQKLQGIIISSINTSLSVKSVFGCNTPYYYQIIPKIKDAIIKNDLFHAFEENDDRESDVISSASIIDNRIVINEVAKQFILSFYDRHQIDLMFHSKIKIIQNGIELKNSPFQKKTGTHFKIGFIGRWSTEKRAYLFLEIATQVKKKYPEVSFVMAGTGMKINLNKIIQAGVEFLGELTNDKDLEQLYKDLYLILLPSKYEGFPMVIMEGMAQGVIPIATNVGGISEHIVNDKNGILINDGDEKQIIKDYVSIIENLLPNKIKMEMLSQNAYNYALHNFQIQKFNDSYRQILFKK
ncbi:glycosyltransferase family 4 protein [Flavobacterium flavipallidum]|uniref:Glycosyltransferase family 4 protein n=1 Tax=Flavobacterium flavipallidum TaxID=3139140 RepID=A0ABU9HJ59_9FLAO